MECFIGTILPWPINFAPQGWALCNGQSIPVAQNAALYSLIGNTYGGDQNNFNLPDLRGRFPIGQGYNPVSKGTYTIGQHLDDNRVTLAPANIPLPQHTHQIANVVNVTGGGGSVPVNFDVKIPVNSDPYNGATAASTPANNNCTLAAAKTTGGQNVNIYTTSDPTTGASLKPFTVQTNINVPAPSVTVNSVCGVSPSTPVAPFAVMAPYLCMNYIIALEGIYPMRS